MLDKLDEFLQLFNIVSYCLGDRLSTREVKLQAIALRTSAIEATTRDRKISSSSIVKILTVTSYITI